MCFIFHDKAVITVCKCIKYGLKDREVCSSWRDLRADKCSGIIQLNMYMVVCVCACEYLFVCMRFYMCVQLLIKMLRLDFIHVLTLYSERYLLVSCVRVCVCVPCHAWFAHFRFIEVRPACECPNALACVILIGFVCLPNIWIMCDKCCEPLYVICMPVWVSLCVSVLPNELLKQQLAGPKNNYV